LKVVIDIECNSLVKPTQIWCIVCKDIDTGVIYVYRNLTTEDNAKREFLSFAKDIELFIGHNFLGYDWPVMQDLIGISVDDIASVCIDTLVISKLVDYPRQGHSIENYGQEFGLEKIKFNDFKQWSQELEDYCVRDVEICHDIYNKYRRVIDSVDWKPSIQLEHNFQLVVNALHNNGFSFNTSRANTLLAMVTKELEKLDGHILEAFPPRLKQVRVVVPEYTKFGTLHKKDFRWVKDGDLSEFNGGPFCRCAWSEFNPSSHRQIVTVLREAGWAPTDKTQTHIDTEREIARHRLEKRKDRVGRHDVNSLDISNLSAKLEILKNTGWKVNENNLETLPKVEDCRVKLSKEEELIIKNVLNTSEKKLSDTTIKIPESTKTGNSVEITELLLTLLNRCLKSKTDVARFVENERHLWLIIVTPQAVYVDFSASYATDISDGMKDLTPGRLIILENLKENFHSAPSSARSLARRILYESRRRTLTEWLGLCDSSSRIHGKFYGIGAWTHRMAHQQPNTANIPNEFDLNGNKKLLGKELRSLWQAPRNRLLVGVDAEGIQLRIFAHYINDEEFTDALVRGRKDDKSDPHSLNQRILGEVCKTRASAKRFVYALLLGAGIGKLASILETNQRTAEEALDRLLKRYGGFAKLKEEVIPNDAKRGWFVGLDGRRVKIPGDSVGERRHLCMSGYLQNGEAVIMKKATIRWMDTLDEYDAMLVNFVHDEWQTECPNNMSVAINIAEMQADSLRIVGEELGLRCPLAGSFYNDDLKDYTISTNWSKTH